MNFILISLLTSISVLIVCINMMKALQNCGDLDYDGSPQERKLYKEKEDLSTQCLRCGLVIIMSGVNIYLKSWVVVGLLLLCASIVIVVGFKSIKEFKEDLVVLKMIDL